MDPFSVHDAARLRPLRTICVAILPPGASTGRDREVNLGIGLALLSELIIGMSAQKSRSPRPFSRAFTGHLLSARPVVGSGKQ